MKKQKNQKNQYLQLKQEETNWQKFTSAIFRFFVAEDNLTPEISQAVVAGSYFQISQIFSLINIIIIFTVFNNTNSLTYSIIISSLCTLMIIFDTLPKVSKKHFVFNFVSIAEGLLLIGMVISSKFFLDNYFVFVTHCQDFSTYHSRRNYVIGPKDEILEMCRSISFLFIAEIIVEAAFVVCKTGHVCLYIRAYRQAKEKFEEEERKRRRKDRYNEMIRKKNIFNEKRKV